MKDKIAVSEGHSTNVEGSQTIDEKRAATFRELQLPYLASKCNSESYILFGLMLGFTSDSASGGMILLGVPECPSDSSSIGMSRTFFLKTYNLIPFSISEISSDTKLTVLPIAFVSCLFLK